MEYKIKIMIWLSSIIKSQINAIYSEVQWGSE